MLHLQHPGVSGRAVALAGLVVAGGSVVALALEVAALAVGARLAELLAAPAAEAVGAHAGARDGVAERFVLALAPVAAVGPPVLAVTACEHTPSYPRGDTGLPHPTAPCAPQPESSKETPAPKLLPRAAFNICPHPAPASASDPSTQL